MSSSVSASADPAITPAEWRAFWRRLLHAAGLGSLGAGVVFFVAANWQAWGLVGRFGLLEAGLLACVATALWQPAPARAGQGALLLATLFTGALLALFGQSYQTGADTYELFFAWALLALPFALAARSGAVWATWWAVLDAALLLLCGLLGLDHIVWRMIDGWGLERGDLLMLPCVANLAGAACFQALQRTRLADAAPAWLVRALLVVGVGCGAAAAMPEASNHPAAILAACTAIALGIGAAAHARRRDIFALTLLAGAAIATSTAWLVHELRFGNIGELFMVAAWLVGTSSAAAMLLMRWWRAWRTASNPGATA